MQSIIHLYSESFCFVLSFCRNAYDSLDSQLILLCVYMKCFICLFKQNFTGVQFIILCQFQVYTQVNLLHKYIYPVFLKFFSHIGHYRVEFPVLCSRSLLAICFTYSGMCMSIPVSQFIPPHYPPHPPVPISFLHLCFYSVLQISSFVPLFVLHISDIIGYLSFSVCYFTV